MVANDSLFDVKLISLKYQMNIIPRGLNFDVREIFDSQTGLAFLLVDKNGKTLSKAKYDEAKKSIKLKKRVDFYIFNSSFKGIEEIENPIYRKEIINRGEKIDPNFIEIIWVDFTILANEAKVFTYLQNYWIKMDNLITDSVLMRIDKKDILKGGYFNDLLLHEITCSEEEQPLDQYKLRDFELKVRITIRKEILADLIKYIAAEGFKTPLFRKYLTENVDFIRIKELSGCDVKIGVIDVSTLEIILKSNSNLYNGLMEKWEKIYSGELDQNYPLDTEGVLDLITAIESMKKPLCPFCVFATWKLKVLNMESLKQYAEEEEYVNWTSFGAMLHNFYPSLTTDNLQYYWDSRMLKILSVCPEHSGASLDQYVESWSDDLDERDKRYLRFIERSPDEFWNE